MRYNPLLPITSPPEELKGMVDKPAEGQQLDAFLSSLSSLHRSYLSPASPTHIPLIPDPAPSLEAVLSPSLSPVQRCDQARETQLVQQLYLQVYQLLEETYYPQYCQSKQVGPSSILPYDTAVFAVGQRASMQFHVNLFNLFCRISLFCSSTPSTWYSRPMAIKLLTRNGPSPPAWNELRKRGVAKTDPSSLPSLWRTSIATPDQRSGCGIPMM